MSGGCNNSPPAIGNLTFFDTRYSGDPNHNVIWMEPPVPRFTWAYGAEFLAPVTQHGLPIETGFAGPSAMSEAVYFERDPNDYSDALNSDGFTAISQGDTNPWDTDADAAPGVSLKWETGYPLDNERFIFGADFGSKRLTRVESIQSVYAYDHGSCSLPESLLGAVQPAVANLQSNITSALPAGGAALVRWLRVASFLEHQRGQLLGLQGGIYVNTRIDASAIGVPVSEIRLFLKLFLGLDANGQVQITYNTLFQDPPSGVVGNVITDRVAQAVAQANQTNASLQRQDLFVFHDKNGFVTQDLRPLLGGGLSTSDCLPELFNAACTDQEQYVGTSWLHDGVVALNLSPNDENALKATITDPQNWSCQPETDTVMGLVPGTTFTVPHHRCQYFVPAKRLNYYPDAVEAVWFDGPKGGQKGQANCTLCELQNPAYALFVALNEPLISKFSPGALSNLCGYAPTPAPTLAPNHPWLTLAQ